MIVTEKTLEEVREKAIEENSNRCVKTPVDLIHAAEEIWPGSNPTYISERGVIVLKGIH